MNEGIEFDLPADEKARWLSHGERPPPSIDQAHADVLLALCKFYPRAVIRDRSEYEQDADRFTAACVALRWMRSVVEESQPVKPLTAYELVLAIESGRFTERERAALAYAVDGIVPV